jgi:hypothetical protein
LKAEEEATYGYKWGTKVYEGSGLEHFHNDQVDEFETLSDYQERMREKNAAELFEARAEARRAQKRYTGKVKFQRKRVDNRWRVFARLAQVPANTKEVFMSFGG